MTDNNKCYSASACGRRFN